MLSEQKAEPGHSGNLGSPGSLPPGSLPLSIIEKLGVKDGTIEISKDDSPKVILNPSRPDGNTYKRAYVQIENLLRISKYPDSYKSRIKFLKDEAIQEGIMLSEASEMDFRRFVFAHPNLRKGSLVLTDNGNIRAIWKGSQGSHLGLQFLGSGMVQYVMFNQRENKKEISRASGRDAIREALWQINAFGLVALLVE